MANWIEQQRYETVLSEIARRHGLKAMVQCRGYELIDARTFKTVCTIALNGMVWGIKEGVRDLCSPEVIKEVRALKQ